MIARLLAEYFGLLSERLLRCDSIANYKNGYPTSKSITCFAISADLGSYSFVCSKLPYPRSVKVLLMSFFIIADPVDSIPSDLHRKALILAQPKYTALPLTLT